MIKKITIIIAFIIITIGLFFYWENNSIVTTEIEYKNTKIPNEFKGYRIAHISDLHNKEFGKNQERLLKELKATSPDIIVITGDLIDRRKYDLDTAMTFINGAKKIAPIYYVYGNHEGWSNDFKNIKKTLSNSGIKILDDKKTELIKDGAKIEILGLLDPALIPDYFVDGKNLNLYQLEESLKKMSDDSIFQILLCHRPEIFDIYVKENIDLIFSGHAHGGQIRIPFIGALMAPDQGLFPKYTSGMYEEKGSTMVVSRGLGNSIMPIRTFNRPEIIVLTLDN